jgi:hypothetical protein
MFTILFAAVLLTGGLSQSALAALGQVGPVNPANGFPVWYQDTAGLRLDLCLDQTGFCLTEEPNPAAPIAFPNNFGPEAFWWVAETAFVDAPTGLTGLLVLAMEAAFANELPVEGDQVAFARIRIRIDVPQPGTYTVTHPFGVATYEVLAVDVPGGGGANEINETQDLGNFLLPGRLGDFTIALADGPNPPVAGARVNADGRSIGPFLTRADGLFVTDPISGFTYLGSPLQNVAVTGSPFGTNFFRVVGPTGTAETALFALMGKISVNQPAAVNHAEYHLKTGKFHIQGFSTIVQTGDPTAVPPVPLAPTEITIFLGTDPLTSPEIGKALVHPTTGLWVFNGKVPLSPGGAGGSVAVTSTADPTGPPTILPLILR